MNGIEIHDVKDAKKKLKDILKLKKIASKISVFNLYFD